MTNVRLGEEGDIFDSGAFCWQYHETLFSDTDLSIDGTSTCCLCLMVGSLLCGHENICLDSESHSRARLERDEADDLQTFSLNFIFFVFMIRSIFFWVI